jgi:hypothetical protein
MEFVLGFGFATIHSFSWSVRTGCLVTHGMIANENQAVPFKCQTPATLSIAGDGKSWPCEVVAADP